MQCGLDLAIARCLDFEQADRAPGWENIVMTSLCEL